MTASLGVAADAIYVVAAVPLLIAVVVAAAVWRSAKRERIVRGLKSELTSRDPDVRKRALDATTEEDLARHADLYCDLLAREGDPEVLDALAAAVARSRWEPSDDAALVELRRWVAGGHARATQSSDPASGGAPTRSDGPTPRTGRSSPAVATAEPSDAVRPREDLDDLVPRVRELLGDTLERLELVSIDGEVLKQWSSTTDAPRRPEVDAAP